MYVATHHRTAQQQATLCLNSLTMECVQVSTMTLITLGQKLRLSNSERNMLHGKICAYARFVETEYERTKLKSAVHFGKALVKRTHN